ncbi:hypothetical protein, partial [uncultured Corynebacterium sp.]|uniref:hypothetical protein n=1 Tax=uncultured Corynebacterium sp. TaxID=159447 RepID=UPI00288B1A2A
RSVRFEACDAGRAFRPTPGDFRRPASHSLNTSTGTNFSKQRAISTAPFMINQDGNQPRRTSHLLVACASKRAMQVAHFDPPRPIFGDQRRTP